MTTWVEGAAGSLFDVDNLPYGVFSRPGEEPRVGVRIGEWVLDLSPVAADARPATPYDGGSPVCSPTTPGATGSSRTSCRSRT